MRKIAVATVLTTMLCLAVPASFAGTPPASKSGSAVIVIVFKDGHRQSFNLSDISRVEFPAASEAAASGSVSSTLPRHFLGKWEVGDGNGNNFFITLYDDGDARKSLGGGHGKWVYADGEAQITWDDGWRDAI